MRANDLCVVKVATSGKWAEWTLAHVKAFDEVEPFEEVGTGLSVTKFRVVGEDFDREEHNGIYLILPDDKQAAAVKLASQQWGRLKLWGEKVDDLKQAIINASW